MQAHSFGNWLKTRRKSRDLTQAELADQVGCSAAAIRKLEAEERRPSAQIVERLAKIFEIPQNEQANFLRFARGEMRSAPATTKEDFPWQSSVRLARTNLPATVTSLIGREKEIAEVHDYLSRDNIRLVTLIGPPGIGKTRLSIESARAVLPNFPDGVFFVALAPLDDPALIPQTVAQSLGYVGTRNISTTDQLKDGMGEKQILLVLDNCEHLIEAVASFVSFLLSACPRVKLLATSRESLRIAGEWLYPVPTFDFPEETSFIDAESASSFPALLLFAERARAVRPDFTLNSENIQTISAICSHLDGLPLAIELMAARMRFMTPQAVLEHWNNQFVLTADGMRAASVRQKTLNNAIAWSYKLLSNEEQKLFANLSVFSGGFTVEMAETIFSRTVTEKSVSDLITSLLDKSLLRLVFDEDSQPRYTMLVTIQEYARERLRDIGEETKVRDRHLEYFFDLTANADKELRGRNQLEWLQRLEDIRDNLRAALDWAIETRQTKSALQLVRKLDWFWFIRSDHNEGRQWLARVLEMKETSSYPDAQAEALTQLAHHTWLQIGEKTARPFAEQALSIARAHADRHNIARALAILGLVLADEKKFLEAESAWKESIALYQEVNDEWGYAHAMLCLGGLFHALGDQTTALSLREQALALFRKLGDRYFESVLLGYVGMVQTMQSDVELGMVALQESLGLAKQLDSKYVIALSLWYFARASQAESNHLRTVHLFLTAKNAYDSIGAWTKEHELRVEDYLKPSRAALGESAFAEAVEQGRAMTMEQAVAYALEENL